MSIGILLTGNKEFLIGAIVYMVLVLCRDMILTIIRKCWEPFQAFEYLLYIGALFESQKMLKDMKRGFGR